MRRAPIVSDCSNVLFFNSFISLSKTEFFFFRFGITKIVSFKNFFNFCGVLSLANLAKPWCSAVKIFETKKYPINNINTIIVITFLFIFIILLIS